jgi:hypothetical protein
MNRFRYSTPGWIIGATLAVLVGAAAGAIPDGLWGSNESYPQRVVDNIPIGCFIVAWFGWSSWKRSKGCGARALPAPKPEERSAT